MPTIDFVDEAAIDFQEDAIDFQPEGKSEKYLAMQKEMADLQTEGLADEITSKIIEGTEGVVGKIAYPAHALLDLPVQLARMMGIEAPPSASVPALSQETALKGVEAVTPGGAASEGTVGQAVQELAAGFISGATTPTMVAGMVAGGKAPVAIARAFQAEMLGHVPASVAAVVQAEPGQAKTAAALELGVNVALPALIEKGISKPTPKQIIENRAAEVGPATEAAVKGKEVVSTPPAPTTPLETATSELVKPAEVAQPIPAEPSLPIVTTKTPEIQPYAGPTIVMARRMGDTIRLEFDASKGRVTPDQIRQMFAGENRSVQVRSIAADEVSTTQGRAFFEVDVHQPNFGPSSETLAAVAYKEAFGSDAPIIGRSAVEQALPLEQRLATALKQSDAAPVERITELKAPPISELSDAQIVSLAKDAGVTLAGYNPALHDLRIEHIRKSVTNRLQELSDKGLLDRRTIQQPQPELVGMGAATPAEYVQTPQTATGIKNRTVDLERAKRDLPPAMEAGRQSFGEAWERAMGRMDKDTEYQRRLIAELGDKPRAVTDIEDATLLHRQIDLQNEYGKATRAMAQAFDDGRMEDVAHEQVRVSELSDQLHELYTINQAVGTETGRGLAARKMMAYEDFSLAKMEVERRAAKGGEGLTPEERAEVVMLQQKIETTQKAYDAYVSKTQQQITALEMKAALAATTKKAQETISPKIKAIAERLVNNLEREADAAWKRIQERGLTFGSGPLHELPNIKDFAIIGASKAVKAGVDYAQWSVSMARQFGEGIRPHLERIWDESQKMLNSLEEMRPFAQEAPKRRKPNQEETKLSFEAVQAKKEWQQKLADERRNQSSTTAKVFDKVSETVGLMRVLMTTGEFSAVLKQGGFLGFSAPMRSAKSLPAMFKALRSKEGEHGVNMEIKSRENYPRYVRHKLFLAEHGHSLSKMEEATMSRLADKIPVVRGFQRSHPAYLNKLRADAMDAIIGTLMRRGHELTPERLDLVAEMINISTGRGSFKSKAGQSQALGTIFARLNQLFFAPQWVVSRFQLATGVPFWRALKSKDPAMIRLVAEQYGKFLAGMGVMYGMWKLAGGDIGTDPNSTDFGKLILPGGRTIDMMAGLQQGSVLMHRLITGEKTTAKGKTVPIRGEKVPYGGDDSFDVLMNFGRTKLAPFPSSVVDLGTGKDVTGKPVTMASELREASLPMTYRDIYNAMRRDEIPADVAIALLAMLGAGVQTKEER